MDFPLRDAPDVSQFDLILKIRLEISFFLHILLKQSSGIWRPACRCIDVYKNKFSTDICMSTFGGLSDIGDTESNLGKINALILSSTSEYEE